MQLRDCAETCAFANTRRRSRYHNRLALEALRHCGGHCSSCNLATEWCAENRGAAERWRLQKLRKARELLFIGYGQHAKPERSRQAFQWPRLNFNYLRI